MTLSERTRHEVQHGKMLSQCNPEKLWGWNTPAGQRRAERRAGLIISRAGLAPGVTALEIGCGTGFFTAKFAASGARIVAVDLSPDLIAVAKTRSLPAGQVEFRCQPFEEMAEELRFDRVIGSSVLHHLDLAPALHKIFSLLKPGGILCFAEPNLLNPQIFLERRFRRFFPYVSPDESAFIRRPLHRNLVRAGFADISTVPVDWLHPQTPRLLIPVVEAIQERFEHIPVLREFAGSLLITATKPL